MRNSIISGTDPAQIALGMTGASFDSARREGVVGIEANIDAMSFIARKIGYTAITAAMSSLVIITRDSSDTRALINRWDNRLPKHQGDPNTVMFFSAAHLDQDPPPSANWEIFANVAKRIGAPALTEVSIPSWKDDTTHAGDFATGLLLGQRPIDLLSSPSVLRTVSSFFNTKSKALAAIKAVRNDQTMPKPFIIRRLPQIGQ